MWHWKLSKKLILTEFRVRVRFRVRVTKHFVFVNFIASSMGVSGSLIGTVTSSQVTVGLLEIQQNSKAV